jgi:hypothetical protein
MVMARLLLSAGLVMMWVPRMQLRPHAYLARSLVHQGLNMWALLPLQGLGGEISEWWWSQPCHGWHLIGPLLAIPGPNQAWSGVGTVLVGALR